MSGLEVAAAVAGIVSGCASAISLFRKWRAQQKRKLDYGSSLEWELNECAHQVQREYDNAYKMCGVSFAVGDDSTRSSLGELLVIFESDIIETLTTAVEENTFVDIKPLKRTVQVVHKRTTTVLIEQRVRLSPESSVPGPSRFQSAFKVHVPQSSLSIWGPKSISNTWARIAGFGTRIRNMLSSPGYRQVARRKGTQRYCAAAVWVQKTGVAKTGVGKDHLGCPDCYWGHWEYPPPYLASDPTPIINPFANLGERHRSERLVVVKGGAEYVLTHPFFVMSHLYIPRDITSEVYKLRGHRIFGCVFCGRKGKVNDFDDYSGYTDHIENHHNDKDLRRERTAVEQRD